MIRVCIILCFLALGACATQRERGPSDVADPATDEYVTAYRILGLYPLARIPVAFGFRRWQRSYERDIKRWSVQNTFTWSPATTMSSAPRDVQRHAPIFHIAHKSTADRFGRPFLSQGGTRVLVDTDKPAVLWRRSQIRFQGALLDQISYIVWFPRRPKTSHFDLTGGSLDILIFRVTLNKNGAPLLYDTIHGCGCYHLFFPVPPTARKPMPEDKDLREAAYVPFNAPILQAGERLAVNITASDHYVVGLEATSAARASTYELHDARPVTARFNHLYDQNGILPQSKRLERFILWPMGIRSAGAMRAWGRHATAFVGKRHFDDIDLLEKAFQVPNPP